MSERARLGRGTAVVPTSQGGTVADDGHDAEGERAVAETVSEVAQRHGVHSSLLFRWRRRYRKAPDTDTGFVAVVVEAPEPVSAAGAGRMEIVLGEDVRVIVDATVHAGALARVLTVVSGR